jgi:hypothetical protein
VGVAEDEAEHENLRGVGIISQSHVDFGAGYGIERLNYSQRLFRAVTPTRLRLARAPRREFIMFRHNSPPS